MATDKFLEERIIRLEAFLRKDTEDTKYQDTATAVTLAQTVVHETLGGGHPITKNVDRLVEKPMEALTRAAIDAIVTMYKAGRLTDPRLRIAHELEGEVLASAETQAKAAEQATDPQARQMRLAVAAFLAGAALEDGLRRLCDKHGVTYDPSKASIAKLANALYAPSQQVEHITLSEHKAVTSWGDTRNKADHGRFADLGLVEVSNMIRGVQDFLERRLA